MEDWLTEVDNRVEFALAFGASLKNESKESIVKKGDRAIIVAGFPTEDEGQTNCIRIM
jgi:pyruvate kinase